MSDIEKLRQEIIQKFGTPCAVIDLDIVDKNIAHLQALCDNAKLANRPHIKTHKSPLLALQQVAAGAIGITCQKLGEAEVMACEPLLQMLNLCFIPTMRLALMFPIMSAYSANIQQSLVV